MKLNFFCVTYCKTEAATLNYIKRHDQVKLTLSEYCNTNTNRLLAACEELWVGDRIAEVRTQDVRLESFGWFVCHLHTVLKHSYREVVRRVAGQPQPEVRVDFIRVERFLWGKRRDVS